MEQGLKHTLEIVFIVTFAHDLIQLGQTVQNPAFQLGHIGRFNRVAGVKIGQRAQHKAHGIAQAAVTIGHIFQDFITDTLIGRKINLCHPKAQNIGTVLFGDLFGHHGVAQ